MKITKRDGRREDFNKNKITAAVCQAYVDTENRDALSHKCMDLGIAVANRVSGVCDIDEQDGNEITVPYIERLVEDVLMDLEPAVARSYIEYRHDRDTARAAKSDLYQKVDSLIISKDDTDLLHENANKNSDTIPTMRDMLAGIVSRERGLQYIKDADKEYGAEIAKAHRDGVIHFHDLDYSPLFPITNCCLIDLKGMLENGFRMGNAEIGTPHSITTAAAVTAQIIAQVASHQYGGCTINGIDTILEPYVALSAEKHRADAEKFSVNDKNLYVYEKTNKDVYDAMQALEYEINTLHTANGQTPFVTLGFGLGTSEYAVMIQEAILRVRINGLGVNHRTAVFPKLVFAIKKGLNDTDGTPNYRIKRLAVECAAKRMYPDILSYDKCVEVTGSFKFPMGCRSFLSPWKNEKGELVHDGRNNLGVVSLNLPRIALACMNCEDPVDAFFGKLEDMLKLCRRALDIRIHRFDNVPARVAPILYMEGAFGVRLKADDLIADIFKNGRSSVSLGYIGVHECVNALLGTGESMAESVDKQELGELIVNRLHTACEEWKNETGYGFSLYGTPAENLCKRFCELDAKTYGIIEGVTDKGYYTNSFHIDVRESISPYEKIELEKRYPPLSNGGFICYAEFPNMQNNLDALEDVWDYACSLVPYFGTNTPVDQCFNCGYEGEFDCTSKGFQCPDCGCHDSEKISVIRRVCGYLGAPDARPFNRGKQQEVMNRAKHL